MRRHLLLYIACLFAVVVQADDRRLTGVEYWIDDGHLNRTTVNIGSDGLLQFALDGSKLSEGLHALRYRAKDSEGYYSPTQSWLFYRTQAIAAGTTTLDYWVDAGEHAQAALTNNASNFLLDATKLSEGLHQLNYRATSSNGQSSPVQTWLFYRQRLGSEVATKVTTLEYWVDNRNDLLKCDSVRSSEISFVLDASALNEGLHSLNYRTQDDQGHYSPTQQWLFYRYVNDVAGGSMLEYWIDDSEQHDSIAVADSVAAFTLDASQVEEGLHTLHYRLNILSGQTGAESTWLFYRVAPAYAGGTRTLEYWIDEGEHLSRSADEADVAFVLDASAMEEGLHTFHYQLKEEGGHMSPQQSWMFYRIASTPKAAYLKWYRIWWNNHEEKAIEVQLPVGTAQYLYEETLAVPEYARNDGYSRDNTARFHIVFCNDQGQLSPIESAVVPYPDKYPPVTTLTVTKEGSSAKLTWTANADDVRDYNIYYSEDGQPYVLWKPNVKQQEATFRGQKGCTYSFIVTARDINGNYEAMEESKAKKVTF